MVPSRFCFSHKFVISYLLLVQASPGKNTAPSFKCEGMKLFANLVFCRGMSDYLGRHRYVGYFGLGYLDLGTQADDEQSCHTNLILSKDQ